MMAKGTGRAVRRAEDRGNEVARAHITLDSTPNIDFDMIEGCRRVPLYRVFSIPRSDAQMKRFQLSLGANDWIRHQSDPLAILQITNRANLVLIDFRTRASPPNLRGI